MQWSSGKLWVSRTQMWGLIAVAVILELGAIYLSMFAGASEGISALAGVFALMFPLLGLPVIGSLVRTGDPEAFERAGSEGYCTACGSDNLFELGPGVYECYACGYQGGPGHAALVQQERRAEFAELPEAERRQSAFDDLAFAEKAYAAAASSLRSGASAAATHARAQAQNDATAASNPMLEQGTALFVAANTRVRDAEAKLGISLAVPTEVDGMSSPQQDAIAATQRLELVRAARAKLGT